MKAEETKGKDRAKGVVEVVEVVEVVGERQRQRQRQRQRGREQQV